MNEQQRRLQWQCRRGMLELDLLLQDFLDQYYDLMDEDTQAVFRELLTLPDQTLQDFFFGDKRPDNARIAHVVKVIRQPAPLQD